MLVFKNILKQGKNICVCFATVINRVHGPFGHGAIHGPNGGGRVPRGQCGPADTTPRIVGPVLRGCYSYKPQVLWNSGVPTSGLSQRHTATAGPRALARASVVTASAPGHITCHGTRYKERWNTFVFQRSFCIPEFLVFQCSSVPFSTKWSFKKARQLMPSYTYFISTLVPSESVPFRVWLLSCPLVSVSDVLTRPTKVQGT